MASPTEKQASPLLWPFRGTYYGWGLAGVSLLMSYATVQLYGPVLSVFV